mgnify:FL=1
MRFKLVLSVQTELSGNILPVSYQYELSSCVHRILTEDRGAYEQWLGMNGFLPEMNTRYKLLSVSNFYIPKIKVEEDRLYVLAKRVQLWISTLPERGSEEFIAHGQHPQFRVFALNLPKNQLTQLTEDAMDELFCRLREEFHINNGSEGVPENEV